MSAEDTKLGSALDQTQPPSFPAPRPPRFPGLTHSRSLLRGGHGQKQQKHRAEQHHPSRRQPEASRRHGASAALTARTSDDSTSTMSSVVSTDSAEAPEANPRGGGLRVRSRRLRLAPPLVVRPPPGAAEVSCACALLELPEGGITGASDQRACEVD